MVERDQLDHKHNLEHAAQHTSLPAGSPAMMPARSSQASGRVPRHRRKNSEPLSPRVEEPVPIEHVQNHTKDLLKKRKVFSQLIHQYTLTIDTLLRHGKKPFQGASAALFMCRPFGLCWLIMWAVWHAI